MFKKNNFPWNKGRTLPRKLKARISETLKKKYKEGLIKTGFKNGHPCYSDNLKDYYKNGGVAWNKGLPSSLQPNWRGGITPANEKIRRSPEYIEWRKSVFKRDNYTCQDCKQKGSYLQADHIKPFSLFLELRFDINNGRTLCRDCHRKTDTFLGRIYSYKKNISQLKS